MNKILAAHFMNPDEVVMPNENGNGGEDGDGEKPRVRPKVEAKEERREVGGGGPIGYGSGVAGWQEVQDLESEEDEDGYY